MENHTYILLYKTHTHTHTILLKHRTQKYRAYQKSAEKREEEEAKKTVHLNRSCRTVFWYFNEMCQVTVWLSPISHPSSFANFKIEMEFSVGGEKFMREMKIYIRDVH